MSYEPWPERTALVHTNVSGQRWGRTPDGAFPGVTGVIKNTLGLSTEDLVRWSARTEREACLETAAQVIDSLRHHPDGVEMAELMTSALGPVRAAQRKMEQAANIGKELHHMVEWFLRRGMGEEVGDPPELSAPAMTAYVQWTMWWQMAGITPVRVEQPIWDTTLGYSGTADLVGERGGRLGVWDFKSSSGIYLDHHLQVAAYVHAAKRWGPIEFGEIVRLPKVSGSPFDPVRDVEPCGEFRHGKRSLTQEQLIEVWAATLTAWRALVGPQEMPA